MAAPRGASESSNTIIYVLVTFIVLFLAMSIFAIMQYMDNEKLIKDEKKAKAELAKIGNPSDISKIRSLGNTDNTALSQLTVDMLDLCTKIGGEPLAFDNLANARIKATERCDELISEIEDRRRPEGSPEVSITAGLASVVQTLIQESDSWYSDYQQALEDMKQLEAAKDSVIAQKVNELAQKQVELEALSEKAAAYSRQVTDTTAEQLQSHQATQQIKENENSELAATKAELEAIIELLQKDLAEHKSTVIELQGILQKERPAPEMEMLALETDGYIVAVTGDNLVYINLTSEDRVYPGLTFGVYDSIRSVTKDGAGKATIEVIEVGDTVSKCRVTESNIKHQILKDDHIANLVWNKNKNYIFTVIGEYDFDRNGKIDPDGRKRIEGLVKAWDGIVTNRLSVKTDFVVIGEKPDLPEQTIGGTEIDYEEAQLEVEKAILEYENVLAEAAVMGVPVFTTGRFMKFIGYHEKATKVYGVDLVKLRIKLKDQKRKQDLE